MILIISADEDLHTQAVVDAIEREGGQSRVLDLSRFPARSQLSIAYEGSEPLASFCDLQGPLDLAEVGAIWWRRPQPFDFDDDLDKSTLTFALEECREAIDGLWQILDAAWINDPVNDERAHRKVLQLKVAGECGLNVPETLITNDVILAASFAANGPCIYKPFSGTLQHWRETRLFGKAEQESLELLRYSPIILQHYIDGVDVRVTCVGDQLFAAEIDVRETKYPFDFRMSLPDAHVSPCTLPPELAAGIRRLMERLGLVYGALDFRRLADGRFLFLEINPAGQWLFVEEPTGLPIAFEMARALMRMDQERICPVRPGEDPALAIACAR